MEGAYKNGEWHRKKKSTVLDLSLFCYNNLYSLCDKPVLTSYKLFYISLKILVWLLPETGSGLKQTSNLFQIN